MPYIPLCLDYYYEPQVSEMILSVSFLFASTLLTPPVILADFTGYTSCVTLIQHPGGSSYLLCGDESGCVTMLQFPTPTIRLFTGMDSSSRAARITLQVCWGPGPLVTLSIQDQRIVTLMQ